MYTALVSHKKIKGIPNDNTWSMLSSAAMAVMEGDNQVYLHLDRTSVRGLIKEAKSLEKNKGDNESFKDDIIYLEYVLSLFKKKENYLTLNVCW